MLAWFLGFIVLAFLLKVGAAAYKKFLVDRYEHACVTPGQLRIGHQHVPAHLYVADAELDACETIQDVERLGRQLLRYDHIARVPFKTRDTSRAKHVKIRTSTGGGLVYKIGNDHTLETYGRVFTSANRQLSQLATLFSVIESPSSLLKLMLSLFPDFAWAAPERCAGTIRRSWYHCNAALLVEKNEPLVDRDLFETIRKDPKLFRSFLFALWICLLEKISMDKLKEKARLPAKVAGTVWFVTYKDGLFYPVAVQQNYRGEVLWDMVDHTRVEIRKAHADSSRLVAQALEEFLRVRDIDYNIENFIFDAESMVYIDTQAMAIVQKSTNQKNRKSIRKLLRNIRGAELRDRPAE